MLSSPTMSTSLASELPTQRNNWLILPLSQVTCHEVKCSLSPSLPSPSPSCSSFSPELQIRGLAHEREAERIYQRHSTCREKCRIGEGSNNKLPGSRTCKYSADFSCVILVQRPRQPAIGRKRIPVLQTKSVKLEIGFENMHISLSSPCI